MALSQATILELQKIIKEEYGKEVSSDESAEISRDLVGYFNLLAKINHRDRNSE